MKYEEALLQLTIVARKATESHVDVVLWCAETLMLKDDQLVSDVEKHMEFRIREGGMTRDTAMKLVTTGHRLWEYVKDNIGIKNATLQEIRDVAVGITDPNITVGKLNYALGITRRSSGKQSTIKRVLADIRKMYTENEYENMLLARTELNDYIERMESVRRTLSRTKELAR